MKQKPAAVNVLALHGEHLRGVRYFVGRENPTQDMLTAVELGHWATSPSRAAGPLQALASPAYDPSEHYDPHDIPLKVARIIWDAHGNGVPGLVDGTGKVHLLGDRVPRMYGKRYYSKKLTRALLEFGALTRETWPAGLATPEEAERDWPLRETVHHYTMLGRKLPDLKVMLVFAEQDHVQVAPDKPHIHQAWDGFRRQAGLSWVRMNPDAAYVRAI